MARFRDRLAHCGFCVPGKDPLGNAEGWDARNKKSKIDDKSHRKGDQKSAAAEEWFTNELRVNLAGIDDSTSNAIRDFWVAKLNEIVDFAESKGAHAEWSPVG